MSTIGHPLSDLCNLLTPYTLVKFPVAVEIGRGDRSFQPGATPGLPTKEQCVRWYLEAAGWDPTSEITWGDAFGVFRNSVIMQGIAARYALRQASSAKASEYGKHMAPFGEIGWSLVQGVIANGRKARL
jgi:aminoglycoside phosphotransferase (APT) family kinase protein